ncbi:MAG TPA: sigma-54 dependent transcriptional regulator [Dongiaceae bacterium]|nr:sigma-54 dependent transcriptional regulator [Dongiaceae bacterium]
MTTTEQRRLLIIDDELNALKAVSTLLKFQGFVNIVTESDSRKALDLLASERFDAVILDLFMPHLTGTDLLPLITERYPQIPVIMVTAAYELDRAVACMKLGAFDYLVKPVENERLVATIRKALERTSLNEQLTDLRDHLIFNRIDHPDAFADIITRDRTMQGLFQYAEIVSRSPQPAMVTGESGTGKEAIVQAIHCLSGNIGKLVSVNLAGLDDTMFSDTLFGHKRGAFTGADSSREGLIVKAAGGTLFLDEIGDLMESSQIKLLRVLQEREFYPVGSDTPRPCDARIICASNKDIKALVAEGRFRNDLYYRLFIHHIALPPLRERKGDIPLLLAFFIAKSAESLGIKPPSYPHELLDLLSIYNFPGNIRELQGMVYDAVARSKSGMISLDSFRNMISDGREIVVKEHANQSSDSMHEKIEKIWGCFPTLQEVEDCLIEAAMKISGNNQGTAAAMLGLKRQTLNMRLKVKKVRS